MTIILIITIHFLLVWIAMLKNEETIEYTTKSDKSIRDLKTLDIFIFVVFGSVLIIANIIMYGLSFFIKKTGV